MRPRSTTAPSCRHTADRGRGCSRCRRGPGTCSPASRFPGEGTEQDLLAWRGPRRGARYQMAARTRAPSARFGSGSYVADRRLTGFRLPLAPGAGDRRDGAAREFRQRRRDHLVPVGRGVLVAQRRARRWSGRGGPSARPASRRWPRRAPPRCAAGRGTADPAARLPRAPGGRRRTARTGAMWPPARRGTAAHPWPRPRGRAGAPCTAGIRCGGMFTSRLPASDLGPCTARPLLAADHAAPHVDDAVLHVDVGAAQLGELAEPQRAPGGQQHHQPVPAAWPWRCASSSAQRRRPDRPGALRAARRRGPGTGSPRSLRRRPRCS